MNTRLAMVACFGPHEGPWLRSRGTETGVRITCLGEGEYIVARLQNGDPSIKEHWFDSNGVFPLPSKFSRISFKKMGGVMPTSVELLIG